MIDEYWDVQWVDGQWYSLHSYAIHVESIYGNRTGVPALRGTNVAVYGRPGKIHQPKIPDEGKLTLRGWVSNVDKDDKQYPGLDCRMGLNRNWRMLRRLLWRPNGATFPLRRRWYNESGALVTAIALVEYAGGLDLSEHVEEAGAWVCELVMPDPYFYGTVETATLVVDTPQTLNNVGDVPCTRMTLNFKDQLSNPIVTNTTPNPDVWVRVGSSIAGGDNVLLNVDTFTATRTSDSANLIGAVTRSGSHPWMVLLPGNNTITLTATSGAGTVDMTWQPAYL